MKMKMMGLSLVAAGALVLSGCGGSDNPSKPAASGYNGAFVDEFVNGLSYECGNGMKSTYAKNGNGGVVNGYFECESTETPITFYISDGNRTLKIGEASSLAAKDKVIFIKELFPKDTAGIEAAKAAALILTAGRFVNGTIILNNNSKKAILKAVGDVKDISELSVKEVNSTVGDIASELGTTAVTPDDAVKHLESVEKEIPKISEEIESIIPPAPKPTGSTGGGSVAGE